MAKLGSKSLPLGPTGYLVNAKKSDAKGFLKRCSYVYPSKLNLINVKLALPRQKSPMMSENNDVTWPVCP